MDSLETKSSLGLSAKCGFISFDKKLYSKLSHFSRCVGGYPAKNAGGAPSMGGGMVVCSDTPSYYEKWN